MCKQDCQWSQRIAYSQASPGTYVFEIFYEQLHHFGPVIIPWKTNIILFVSFSDKKNERLREVEINIIWSQFTRFLSPVIECSTLRINWKFSIPEHDESMWLRYYLTNMNNPVHFAGNGAAIQCMYWIILSLTYKPCKQNVDFECNYVCSFQIEILLGGAVWIKHFKLYRAWITYTAE